MLYKGNWSCTVTFPRNCYGGTNPASQNGKTIKNIDSGEYVHGTETLKELTSEHEEYTAAAVFWSYEVKITAKETCHIKEITDKYVAGDFKATDEKMQELKRIKV